MSTHALYIYPPVTSLPPPAYAPRHGMLGHSTPMQRLFAQLERIGPHVRSALITGETGTGKELAARALHTLGPGAAGPFVVCDASTLVEGVRESEHFGPAKDTARELFESASRGTLFLDEVGEMTPGNQAKLLRVLQHLEMRRATSGWPAKAEMRVLTATHRDLRAMAASGQFRQDLYYRISTVEIQLPPLRARRDDIAVLAQHFAEQYARQYAKPGSSLATETLEVLEQYSWPGNVREMQNVICHAVLQADGEVLLPCDLPLLDSAISIPTAEAPQLLLLEDVVQHHTRRVLKLCAGNKVHAAELLGISRSTLYRMLDAQPMLRS